MHLKTKQDVIQEYYSDPNYCAYCGKIIEIREGQKACDVRVKKFCNRSCSAKFNNKGKNRWLHITGDCSRGFCANCGEEIKYKRQKGGSYSPRQFCEDCLTTERSKILVKRHGKNDLVLEERTKGDLRAAEPNSHWCRSRITQAARRVYKNSGKSKICAVCGFPHGIQVCHKRPIADFPDNALIKEINHPDNLIGLCPNHHWMLDHGLLELDD
jgi:hypothetical protein